MEPIFTIVGHLAPDLDCLTAIWILLRFGSTKQATLRFVPSGQTLNDEPVDSHKHIIHVDTGGGRFDHHHLVDNTEEVCAAELVRRATAPHNRALTRMVRRVCKIDNADTFVADYGYFHISSLINGYNLMFPNRPQHVAEAMFPNLDAWYEHEMRQVRLEESFTHRVEFETPWGLGVAVESDDGASSRLAYSIGAVLYAYRDSRNWMGIAAQSRSRVDLTPIYRRLQRIDAEADWYLHPSRKLLLCGTAKSPPRQISRLSLDELIQLLRKRPVLEPVNA